MTNNQSKEIDFLQEYFEDKSKWGDGPWVQEPDRLEFIDNDTGYNCLILRNKSFGGILCGYVGLPKEHPYYDKNLSLDECSPDLDVHGGITWHGILSEVEKTDKMYVGFDCGHCGDYCPYEPTKLFFNLLKERNPKAIPILDEFSSKYPNFFVGEDRRKWGWTYKDMNFVKEECKKLAKQLKELEK